MNTKLRNIPKNVYQPFVNSLLLSVGFDIKDNAPFTVKFGVDEESNKFFFEVENKTKSKIVLLKNAAGVEFVKTNDYCIHTLFKHQTLVFIKEKLIEDLKDCTRQLKDTQRSKNKQKSLQCNNSLELRFQSAKGVGNRFLQNKLVKSKRKECINGRFYLKDRTIPSELTDSEKILLSLRKGPEYISYIKKNVNMGGLSSKCVHEKVMEPLIKKGLIERLPTSEKRHLYVLTPEGTAVVNKLIENRDWLK